MTSTCAPAVLPPSAENCASADAETVVSINVDTNAQRTTAPTCQSGILPCPECLPTRSTTMSTTETTAALKRTPLHDIHVALGAKMVPFAGYEMPVQYPTGITTEHKAVR